MRGLFYAACLVGSLAAAGQATVSGPAMYWVPVAQELQQFAVFKTTARVTKTAERTTLEYSLPLELTGVANKITLEGPAAVVGQRLVLRGNGAAMECPNETLERCKVSYYELKFDEAARKDFLIKISSDAEELTSRLQVAALFQGGEPHGFLYFLGSQNR